MDALRGSPVELDFIRGVAARIVQAGFGAFEVIAYDAAAMRHQGRRQDCQEKSESYKHGMGRRRSNESWLEGADALPPKRHMAGKMQDSL